MRKYKTVVIDFKRVLRRGVMFTLMAAVSIAGLYMAGVRLIGADKVPSGIILDNIPAIKTDGMNDTAVLSRIGRGVTELLLGFVPSDEESIIGGAMPVYSAVTDGVLVSIAKEVKEAPQKPDVKKNTEKAETPAVNIEIPPENRAPIKSVDLSQKVTNGNLTAIGNETSYSVDINGMLSSPPDINMDSSEPKILIVHTHATESYAPDGAEVYDVTASDRDEDRLKNVVAVGAEMAKVFENKGIKTLHDETLHDAPSFNGSYAHSLASVTEYMQKYPSISIVLDIHRDSIVYDDNTKAKAVTEINGEKTAQLMLVVGTDENGLENPNWRSNLKSAIHFQRAICERYPKLMRHINLRRERFNGHTSGASMIFEVGTSGNSLEEAKRGITLAAECIADYLNSL